MAKNDFNIDFDFDEEFDFDPKAFLGTDDYDEDIDLSEFTDEELGLSAEPVAAEESAEEEAQDDDFNLDDFLRMAEDEPAEEEPEEFSFSDDADAYAEEEEEEDAYEEPELFGDELPEDEDYAPDDVGDAEPEEDNLDETETYSEEEEYIEQDAFEDEPVEEDGDADVTTRKTPRKKREPVQLPKINLPKITLPKLSTPNIFTKFYDLYFAPVLNKSLIEEPQDPANPRRRRRKSKGQIFKEVYLPPILVCVTLILVMSFLIGALSNTIAEKRLDAQLQKDQQEASISAAAQAEAEYQQLMAQADILAQGYDYEGAYNLLSSFGNSSDYPDLEAKKTELITAQQQLTQHSEPSLIPNLSFHVLIEDLPRAMADDDDLAGSYNKNFVSTGEFKAILSQLYANGYVLVDFDSFTDVSTDTSGGTKVMLEPILLPAGKKPIMITETMVNYYGYMIDSNDDGVADAGGDGFASKLVVQNGKIKAEYVDANGQTLVGDYDLVPILESFIEEHPDFSYKGARATLAVTGYEGIFGYRTNTSYIATKGQAYYDQECASAYEVVNALREAGYTIGCFTYDNIAYRDKSAQQIQNDLKLWTQQITPVIGQVDTLVFARESNISDYSDGSPTLDLLMKTGFRYFVSNGTQPWAEVTSSYVRQNRLMVTGRNMQHYTDQFTGIFDCAAVLDVNVRGNVPN